MQVSESSHGLWELTAAPPPVTDRLTGPVDTNVVVIGAGFAGLSTALHLATAGARVVVLEALDIGFGASGRNAGMVNAGLWVLPEDVIAMLGADHGERLLSLMGGSADLVFSLIREHGILCEAVTSGTIHCAVGSGGVKHLEVRARQWQARGAAIRLFDRRGAAEITGTDAYDGALLDERCGTIQPLAYTRGLAQAAIAKGARIFTRSSARNAVRSDSRWTVEAADGHVRGDWIVVATDTYTTDAWTEILGGLVRVPYFQVATAALPDALRREILPGGQGAFDTKKALSSFRLDASGRFIFGSIGALRYGGTSIHKAWARRSIDALFPALANSPICEAWFGWTGMSRDGLPRLHLRAPNVLSVSGYSGRGIGPGTVFGKALASYILRGDAKDLPVPITSPQSILAPRLRSMVYEAGIAGLHAVTRRRSRTSHR
jgi:glycine/D-amino acid oxidase-like deaminating enzyme